MDSLRRRAQAISLSSATIERISKQAIPELAALLLSLDSGHDIDVARSHIRDGRAYGRAIFPLTVASVQAFVEYSNRPLREELETRHATDRYKSQAQHASALGELRHSLETTLRAGQETEAKLHETEQKLADAVQRIDDAELELEGIRTRERKSCKKRPLSPEFRFVPPSQQMSQPRPSSSSPHNPSKLARVASTTSTTSTRRPPISIREPQKDLDSDLVPPHPSSFNTAPSSIQPQSQPRAKKTIAYIPAPPTQPQLQPQPHAKTDTTLPATSTQPQTCAKSLAPPLLPPIPKKHPPIQQQPSSATTLVTSLPAQSAPSSSLAVDSSASTLSTTVPTQQHGPVHSLAALPTSILPPQLAPQPLLGPIPPAFICPDTLPSQPAPPPTRLAPSSLLGSNPPTSVSTTTIQPAQLAPSTQLAPSGLGPARPLSSMPTRPPLSLSSKLRPSLPEPLPPGPAEVIRLPITPDSVSLLARGPGRYTDYIKIGSGAHGTVYKGCDRLSPLPMAFKLCKGHLDGKFPSTLWRELGALRRLRHPNIVTLRDVIYQPSQSSPGVPEIHFVFDYAVSDMAQVLARQGSRLPAGAVKKWGLEILSGLDHIHKTGIVHFDLKPANILVSSSGSAKIADFGLAEDTSLPMACNRSRTVGSMWYRAPEALMRQQRLGPAFDVWSWACLFGEMLCGNGVAMWNAKSPVETMEWIISNMVKYQENSGDKELWPGSDHLPGVLNGEAAYDDPIRGQYRFRGGKGSDYFFRHVRALLRSRDAYLPKMFDIVAYALCIDPRLRPTCEQVLQHRVWTQEPIITANTNIPAITESHSHW
ncbi:hypothetical protein CF319_g2031 [Tilletia indica]|nr:hypothetical protein CF319_g2031 [Tilletia indica]